MFPIITFTGFIFLIQIHNDTKTDHNETKSLVELVTGTLKVFTTDHGLLFLCFLIFIVFLYYIYSLFKESNYVNLKKQSEVLVKRINQYSEPISWKQIHEIEKFIDGKTKLLKDSFQEFKETLIEDEGYLKNCINSATFFDVDSLIERNTTKNILQQAPGVLASMGIIGTFLGLTGGVQNLSIENPDLLIQGIGTLMGGISSAFLTSILGMIFASIILWLHKHEQRKTYKAILSLQSTIDSKFERINNQNILIDLLKSHRQSYTENQRINERMDQLVEHSSKIIDAFGEKFMVQLANAISQPLNNIMEEMKEVLDKLRNNSASQGESMAGKMKESLSGFSEVMNDSAENFSKKQDELNKTLEKVTGTLNRIIDENSNHIENSKSLENSLIESISLIDKKMENLSKLFGNITKNIENVTEESENKISNFTEEMKVAREKNLNASVQVLSSYQKMAEKQEEMIIDLHKISEDSKEYINALQLETREIKDIMTEILPKFESSFDKFSEISVDSTNRINNIKEKMEDSFEKSNQLLLGFNKSVGEITNLNNNLERTSSSLEKSTSTLSSSFEQFLQEGGDSQQRQEEFVENQKVFLNDLKTTLEVNKENTNINKDLVEKLSQLENNMTESIEKYNSKIDEYNKKLVEAFNRAYQEWDSHITDFANSLAGVCRDTRDAVDELGVAIQQVIKK